MEGIVTKSTGSWYTVYTKTGEKIEPKEVIEFCKNNLSSFKKPKVVHLVDKLPKSPIGKVLRSVLKKEYAE